MEEDNKIISFQEKQIRRIWYNDQWWFSVVDIIEVLTESKNPRKYWHILKSREPQLGLVCGQLKLLAADNRERLTDVANTEGMLRIIMSIPAPKAEPLKIWLAQVGENHAYILENPHYEAFLLQIKSHIESAKTKAIVTVNQQLIHLYWRIGSLILKLQSESEWGSKITLQLSKDLKHSFPAMSGLSERNLKYMRKFAKENPNFEIVQESLAQITWYHNQTLMDKIEEVNKRLWYAHKAIENGWSRDMMVIHIEQNLYSRQGKAITNFKNTLPKPHSDLAQQTFKDPYLFDFLNLTETASERDLENALIAQIEKFLLELGLGFAFIGRQYSIIISEEEHRIDLLFYHIKLHCYVVIDLKIRKFEPEYAGKMNFYVNAVDDLLKSSTDNPTIGMILCKEKDKVKAEYALKGISTPIGVSEFKLSDIVSEEIKHNLPSIEVLERKLKEID
jgi:predicted nuclease of restriction endonuclease-like (RecB) superfamily